VVSWAGQVLANRVSNFLGRAFAPVEARFACWVAACAGVPDLPQLESAWIQAFAVFPHTDRTNYRRHPRRTTSGAPTTRHLVKHLSMGTVVAGAGDPPTNRDELRRRSRESWQVPAPQQVTWLDLTSRRIEFIVCIVEANVPQDASGRPVIRVMPGIQGGDSEYREGARHNGLGSFVGKAAAPECNVELEA